MQLAVPYLSDFSFYLVGMTDLHTMSDQIHQFCSWPLVGQSTHICFMLTEEERGQEKVRDRAGV